MVAIDISPSNLLGLAFTKVGGLDSNHWAGRVLAGSGPKKLHMLASTKYVIYNVASLIHGCGHIVGASESNPRLMLLLMMRTSFLPL